jgi:two-component system response regulator HydG
VPLLMNHFLRREAARHGRQPTGFTPRAVRAMLHYPFPGNIRELQNLIERGVISAEDGAAIDVAHMFRREQLNDEALLAIGAHGTLTTPSDGTEPRRLLDMLSGALNGSAGSGSLSLEELERRLLKEAADAEGGNLAAAARRLGLTRAQFAYRLDKAGGAVPSMP